MLPSTTAYRGNINLKNSGSVTEFTQENILEYIKIKKDPIYFVNNYCKIVHVDKGVVPFKLYPYQEKMIRHFHGIDEEAGEVNPDWRYSLCLTGRQMGKCVKSDTKIRIRNKTTGEIRDTIISDLYNSVKETNVSPK